MAKTPLFVSSLLRHPDAPHSLLNQSGDVVVERVEAAFDSRSRRRGLLGRSSVGEGRGLIIAPCNSIHTFGMRFAIDVIFVRKNGEVVKICRSVPAWRIRLALRAFAVIELDAGTLDRSRLSVGDTVVVTPSAAPAVNHGR